MGSLECLQWRNFMSNDEGIQTEGKAGVPKYDGEASRLAEYTFKVRLRQLREKGMSEEELRKQGPLALRLVDGLRGPALQTVRSMRKMDVLAGEKGVDYLLKELKDNLMPRSQMEARELYQAGAAQGGILSRQRSESMASYTLRRRTWYQMMLDLDSNLSLPDPILAEQLLQNAGISKDHQLLIRTALQQNLTFVRVAEELVAQHGSIHMDEQHRSHYHYDKRIGKGKGYKGSRWRSYHADFETESTGYDDWDSHSQSLGGYEENYDYDEISPHSEAFLSAVDEDEDYYMHEAYGAMIHDGLDDADEEAAEYAADIIQAEYEAYFLRNKAKGQGLAGFSKGAGAGKGGTYNVSGQLTLEERKQRIQSLKQKTRCRRCGQLGHWAGDGSCPKGKSKGGRGKGSGSSLGGKDKDGSKGKSKDRPRQVYFSVNEYAGDYDNEAIEIEGKAMMARNLVPAGHAGHKSGDAASTTTQATSQWSVLDPPSDPYLEARNTMQSTGMTADDLLDAMIRQAEDQRRERANREGEFQRVHHDVPLALPPEPECTFQPDDERVIALERYMRLVPRDHPLFHSEWEDCYLERWSTFQPGHPAFPQDLENIRRWKLKARFGLPKVPQEFEALEDRPRQSPGLSLS